MQIKRIYQAVQAIVLLAALCGVAQAQGTFPQDVSVSTSLTLTSSHMNHLVLATGGSGGINLTLPAASAWHNSYTCVMKVDSGAGSVVLLRAGSDTFNGATSQTLAAQYQTICFGSDGSTKWETLVSSNAATATALAANGTNCSAGNYPLGVDASGNVENCTSASGGSSCAYLSAAGDWFVPLGGFSISNYGGANTNSALTNYGGADSTIVHRFYAACSFNPSQIVFGIQTAGAAGCKMEVGIYDSTGANLLIHSGVLTDATTVACNSTGTKTLTASTSPAATGLGSSQPAGWYILALTSNDTTMRIYGMSAGSDGGGQALGSFAALAANGNASTTNGALASSVSSYSTGYGGINIAVVVLGK